MIGPFDKKEYWLQRKDSVNVKLRRRLAKQEKMPVVAFHDKADWPRKAVSKKAMIKNTKRARRFRTEQAHATSPTSN